MESTRGGSEPGRVTPPTWRFDIAIEEDLIEEVARVHGFDHVPETHAAGAPVVDRRRPPRRAIDEDRAADILVAARLSRGDHLQLRRSRDAGAVLARASRRCALANPISADLAEMRASLWPGLVRALRENQRRQQSRVRLFEMRPDVRHRRTARSREIPVDRGPRGGSRAAGAVGRAIAGRSTSSTSRATSRRCFARPATPAEFRFVADAHPALHPGQTARIVRGDRRDRLARAPAP